MERIQFCANEEIQDNYKKTLNSMYSRNLGFK
jgi:hypothetical protein